MAEKKGTTIVIKKVQGGHGGAHGGAWKVAFADFMTAMMCFFLVMWLMGSDEEIKASIATYFNSPTSSWRMDLNDKSAPLGDKTGAGESVLNGSEGLIPEDLIPKPSKAVNPETSSKNVPSVILEDAVREHPKFPMSIEYMKFSMKEKVLFAPGSDDLTPAGKSQIDQLALLFKGHNGNVKLERKSDGVPYELSLSRLVSFSRYLSDQKYVDEERISTTVMKTPVAGASDQERTIEVIFSK
ncbi:MAG: hypothetical protein KA715_08420 [Xanthomonadaceae bacterium]|nr:hypothetical protein [Xanthomonadaceae bacterium]